MRVGVRGRGLLGLTSILLKDLLKKVVVSLRNSAQAFQDNNLWELLIRFVVFVISYGLHFEFFIFIQIG